VHSPETGRRLSAHDKVRHRSGHRPPRTTRSTFDTWPVSGSTCGLVWNRYPAQRPRRTTIAVSQRCLRCPSERVVSRT